MGLHGLHEVIVHIGTGVAAWDYLGGRRKVEGGGNRDFISRYGLATQDEHPTVIDGGDKGVGRVVHSHDVATFYRPTPQTVVMHETIAAHAQTVAPAVDQHTVASKEHGLQGVTLNATDSSHCRPYQQHDEQADGQYYQGF